MKKKKPNYVMLSIQGVAFGNLFDVLKQLTPTEIDVFNTIFKDSNYGNATYLRQVDISERLDMGAPRVSKITNKLISLGLMCRTRRGFMLNPDYFVVGSLDTQPQLCAVYSKLVQEREQKKANKNKEINGITEK